MDSGGAGCRQTIRGSRASPFPIPPRTLSYRAPQACLHITGHAGGKGGPWYVPITWTGWTVDKEFRAVHEDQRGLSPPGSVTDAEAGGRARTAPRYRRSMLAPILDAPRCKPSLHLQDCGTRCGTTRMRRSRRRRGAWTWTAARAAWNVSRQPAPSSWATGRPHPRPSFPVPSHAPCTHEHIAHLHSLREVHARCERENAHDNSHLRRSRVEGVTPCTL